MGRFTSSNICFKCLLGLLLVSTVFQIVILQLPNWFSLETGSSTISYSLWSICTSYGSGEKDCTSYKKDFEIQIFVCRACAILCMILIALTILTISLYIFFEKFKESKARKFVIYKLLAACESLIFFFRLKVNT